MTFVLNLILTTEYMISYGQATNQY